MVRHPVVASLALAAVLHLVWVLLIANSGGDLAAQDAWAEFALQHPDSAYNLAWYGGMHPVSYSVISPFLMAAVGVRTTMVIVGTISAGLLAVLLMRSRAVRRPLWPALYGAFALFCNAVSGRVTFGIGLMFGLAAVAVIFSWPAERRSRAWSHRLPRAGLAALLSALATASSPVAGLYVGIVAAALWLTGRRPAAYALGCSPVLVVGLSAWLFPFSGTMPMELTMVILPVLSSAAAWVFVPKQWRTVRFTSLLYAVGVVLVWLIPSQIGLNMTRFGLIFGGVVLVAALPAVKAPIPAGPRATGRGRTVLALAVVVVTVWQGAQAATDVVKTTPTASWARELAPLLDQLDRVEADRGRVEVVPVRSHREASALAPYVNLARGWNRQADMERNPLFYDRDKQLSPAGYHQWLRHWAVRFVVLPTGDPDGAGEAEARLVARGQPYLDRLWSDANWKLYKVQDPTPLAAPEATVTRVRAEEVILQVHRPGRVLIRIPYSPWLGLIDSRGNNVKRPQKSDKGLPAVNAQGCLTKAPQEANEGQSHDEWTVLHAPRAGEYRIGARYKLPRGTPCPDELVE
ncbi:MFS transporter [Streptomyces sp. NPDC046261]|uniref:MFS transporter n=1 Tax=Streptomyces sp. NPDC046261 TaxID=3157200 RepID=UPI003403C73E